MGVERGVKESIELENIFKERIRKEDATRLNWAINWSWYTDLLREREKKIQDYKKSSPKALAMSPPEKSDSRTVLPFPKTTTSDYGWLSARKEFTLEVYGAYYENLKQTANVTDASSSVFYASSDVV